MNSFVPWCVNRYILMSSDNVLDIIQRTMEVGGVKKKVKPEDHSPDRILDYRKADPECCFE